MCPSTLSICGAWHMPFNLLLIYGAWHVPFNLLLIYGAWHVPFNLLLIYGAWHVPFNLLLIYGAWHVPFNLLFSKENPTLLTGPFPRERGWHMAHGCVLTKYPHCIMWICYSIAQVELTKYDMTYVVISPCSSAFLVLHSPCHFPRLPSGLTPHSACLLF